MGGGIPSHDVTAALYRSSVHFGGRDQYAFSFRPVIMSLGLKINRISLVGQVANVPNDHIDI